MADKADKTDKTDMATMRLRPAHFRIMAAASLGQFLGQGLSTLVGIVIPHRHHRQRIHLRQQGGRARHAAQRPAALGEDRIVERRCRLLDVEQPSERFGGLVPQVRQRPAVGDGSRPHDRLEPTDNQQWRGAEHRCRGAAERRHSASAQPPRGGYQRIVELLLQPQ